MKKTLAIVLTVVMLLSAMSMISFADGPESITIAP